MSEHLSVAHVFLWMLFFCVLYFFLTCSDEVTASMLGYI